MDYNKKVRKHQGDVFEDGEELLSTLFVLPRGGVMNAAVAGGIGGVLGGAGAAAGMRAGGDRAAKEMAAAQDGRSIAGTFPVCYGLISITDRRILVFDRGYISSKKPQRLVAEYPREVLVGATAVKAGLKRDLTLDFADGSKLMLDAGVSQPFDRFEEHARSAAATS